MSTNSTDSTNNLEDNNNLSTTTNNETSENTSSASLSSTIQDSTKQISDSIKQETSQDSENSNIQNFTDTVFTTTNMLVLAGFLGAYGIVYYFSKRNNNEMEGMPSSNGTNPTSIAIDMFFLIIV